MTFQHSQKGIHHRHQLYACLSALLQLQGSCFESPVLWSGRRWNVTADDAHHYGPIRCRLVTGMPWLAAAARAVFLENNGGSGSSCSTWRYRFKTSTAAISASHHSRQAPPYWPCVGPPLAELPVRATVRSSMGSDRTSGDGNLQRQLATCHSDVTLGRVFRELRKGTSNSTAGAQPAKIG